MTHAGHGDPVDVDPGETITCTYTNSKDATVTIVKDATPNDAQDFDFDGTGTGIAADFDLDRRRRSAPATRSRSRSRATSSESKTIDETATRAGPSRAWSAWAMTTR